jgi:hypothetical protein
MSEEIRSALGYGPEWRERGFVDEAFLRAQGEQFRSGVDPNAEHYRYGAFLRFLDRTEPMDREQIDRYCALAARDPNPAMSGSALVALLASPAVPVSEVRRLQATAQCSAPFLQKVALRRTLLEELATGPPSDALVARCLESGDATVQLRLLETEGVSMETLTALAERGANRPLRNQARVRHARLVRSRAAGAGPQ